MSKQKSSKKIETLKIKLTECLNRSSSNFHTHGDPNLGIVIFEHNFDPLLNDLIEVITKNHD